MYQTCFRQSPRTRFGGVRFTRWSLALLGLLLVNLAPILAEEEKPLLFLFRDRKAMKEGDIVTVLITQAAAASERSQQDSSKSCDAQIGGGSGFLGFIPSASLQSRGSRSAGATVSKSLNLVATVTTKVVKVLPNGLLQIEGEQEITIDKRQQKIKLSGLVRPRDIARDNTVLSTAIAEARIEFKGAPPAQARRKKGLLGAIVEGFTSLMEVIF